MSTPDPEQPPRRPTPAHPQPPRDVLAADEFTVPGSDPSLARRGEAVSLPDEPYPAPNAHDVLAAEEFALPAGPVGAGRAGGAGDRPRSRRRALLGGAGAGAVAGVAMLWRRRR